MSRNSPEEQPPPDTGRTHFVQCLAIAGTLSLLALVGPACSEDGNDQAQSPTPQPGIGLANAFEGIEPEQLSGSDVEDYDLVERARQEVREGRLSRAIRRIRVVNNDGVIDYTVARDAVEATVVRQVREDFQAGYLHPFQTLEAVEPVDDQGQIDETLGRDVIEGEVIRYAFAGLADSTLLGSEALAMAELVDGRGVTRRREARDWIEPGLAAAAQADLGEGLITREQAYREILQIDNRGEYTLDDALAEF